MKTEKITLKLFEIIEIHKHLNGETNDNTGLLSKKLDLTCKFLLYHIDNQIKQHILTIETLQNELVHKYGKINEETNQIIVEPTIIVDENHVINPKYTELINELSGFLNNEVEIDYYPINVEYFKDIEDSTSYKTIYKFLVFESI